MWSDSCMRTVSSSANHMFTRYWKDSQSHNNKEARSQLCFVRKRKGKKKKCPDHPWEHTATLAASRRQISKYKMVDCGLRENREPITNKYMGIHIFFVLHIHTIPAPFPDLSCAAASKGESMQRGGRTTAADLLKHAGALYPLPLPTERGGRAIPWRPRRAWGRRSSSSLHQWVTGQRPSWHTGLPKIHTDRRGNQYPSKRSILYCAAAIYTGAQLRQQCAGGAVRPPQPQK